MLKRHGLHFLVHDDSPRGNTDTRYCSSFGATFSVTRIGNAWRISLPDASRIDSTTSVSRAAKSAGTAHVKMPSGPSFISGGADTSCNFTSPFFDLTTTG